MKTTKTTPQTLDAALELVNQRGWHVFPARIMGNEKKSWKSAGTSNGRNWGMTNDPDEVRRDFASKKRTAIGVPTGAINGIFDIEIDTLEGHGVDGQAALAQLEAEHGPLPDTLMFDSPSGSRHRVYHRPPNIKIKNSNGDLGTGIDVKGDGRMMVVPPSLRPGRGNYRYVNDVAIADAPAWALALVAAPDQEDPLPAAYTLLAMAWPTSGSGRHQAALVVGGFLARLGQSPEQVGDAVETIMAAMGETDRAKELVRTAVDEAEAHAKGKPSCGFPVLAETFGKSVAERVADWLGYQNSNKAVVVRDARFSDVTKNGAPRPTFPNAKVALELLGVECRYDLFALRHEIEGHVVEEFAGTVTDAVFLELRALIHAQFGFDPGKEHIADAVYGLANHHQFHPVCDYFDTLKWDGTPRIDSWLVTYGGAEDTPYVRAVGAIFLTVRRVRKPGSKFDEMLVLESPQGWNKSLALQTMAVRSEWFTDQPLLGLNAKETIEQTSGKWIVEVAELQGMSTREVERVKAHLSSQKDTARLAYGRTTSEAKRQFVFVGTTNSKIYLRDNTGNRRYWPVRVGRFDLDALAQDRDQLWAEAAQREASGADIRLPEELWAAAAEQQQERLVENPLLSRLDALLHDGNEPMEGKVTLDAIMTALDIPAGQRRDNHFKNLAAAMEELGWEKSRRRVGGKLPTVYLKGPEPHRDIEAFPRCLDSPACLAYRKY